jgi:hypothetical protein
MTTLHRAALILGVLLLSLAPVTGALAGADAGPTMATVTESAHAPETRVREGLVPKNYNVGGAVSLNGYLSYSISNVAGTVNMTAEKIRNDSTVFTSGTLRLRLFLTAAPISGAFTYWTIGEYALNVLLPEYAYNNVDVTVPLTTPPDGIYYVHLGIFEYEASCGNATGYCSDDYFTFSNRVQVVGGNISAYVPPVLPPLAIQSGVWWSPYESGSGYAIYVANGVLVMQIYSYRPDGEPQWYLTAGALTNGNRNYTGTLDKYRAGQCIYCGYRPPTPAGNDGIISIQFTSGTTATLKLPGGRTTSIELYPL